MGSYSLSPEIPLYHSVFYESKQTSPKVMIKKKAEKVLNDLYIEDVPVRLDFEDIKYMLEIDDISVEHIDGFEGCLFLVGNASGILLSNKMTSENRKRFTLAHEIGHFMLHRNKAKIFQCKPTHSLSLNSSQVNKDDEVEANKFAAELLMPEKCFRTDMAHYNNIGLNQIFDLSEKYQVSNIATALRYIDYCGYVAAIVISENGMVTSFRGSPEFHELRLFVKPKTQIKPIADSCVHEHDYFNWIEPNDILTEAEYPLFEQSFDIPVIGRTVSLIYFDDVFGEDD